MNLLKFFIILLIIYSCGQNKLIDKFIDLKEMTWVADSTLIYKISTDESNNDKSFFIRIRYSLDYPYQNLYYSYSLIDSLDTIIHNPLNEILLFNQKSGKPIGSGISSLFTIEENIIQKIKLKNNNSYQFHIRQLMRKDYLKGINSVGLMVKKND